MTPEQWVGLVLIAAAVLVPIVAVFKVRAAEIDGRIAWIQSERDRRRHEAEAIAQGTSHSRSIWDEMVETDGAA